MDDPSITDEDNCMYELCQTISLGDKTVKEKGNIMTLTLVITVTFGL